MFVELWLSEAMSANPFILWLLLELILTITLQVSLD